MSETNYLNVAKLIDYINNTEKPLKQQPTIREIAKHLDLTEPQFQSLLNEWAGTTPEMFLMLISSKYAKKVVDGQRPPKGALHDVEVEPMSEAEVKNGGAALNINYSFATTPFGQALVASSAKGVCHLSFDDSACTQLKSLFPNARYVERQDEYQEAALNALNSAGQGPVKLHVKGTEFQLKVWQSLLKVPLGELTTYGAIAKDIGNEKASRAVGTAIGSNPVAFIVPCHRVVQSSGQFGGYMWGPTRKTAIIGWEGAKVGTMVN